MLLHTSFGLASVVARRRCNQPFGFKYEHAMSKRSFFTRFASFFFVNIHSSMYTFFPSSSSSFTHCFLSFRFFLLHISLEKHLHRCVNILCIYALNLHNLRRDMAQHDQVYFRVFCMNEIMINRRSFSLNKIHFTLFILS